MEMMSRFLLRCGLLIPTARTCFRGISGKPHPIPESYAAEEVGEGGGAMEMRSTNAP